MKAIVRLGFLVFILSFLFAITSTAINREDALSWWLKSYQSMGKSQVHQAQVGLRSTEATRYRLDSMLVQSPDTATMLTTIPQKLVFLYDTSGKHSAIWKYERDDNTLPWSLEGRDVFTYDTQGRILNDTLFAKDSDTGHWYPSEIRENLFDAQGRLLMENSKYRYNESDAWSGEYKKEYQLDVRGKLVGQLSYTLSKEDVWAQSGKRVSLSDGTRDTAWYEYVYSSFNSSWSLKSKEWCQYDSIGHFNLRTIRQWNADSLCWTIRRKIDYAYDDKGNKIREYSYDLDSISHEWIQDAGEEWTFDERGNLLSNTSILGKGAWIFWGLTMKTELQYDYSIASTEVVFSPLNPLDYPVFNLVSGGSLSIYMPPQDSWYESATITCYYSDLDVALSPSTSTNAASWYYNTTSKCLLFDSSVNLASVKLFDLQGRTIKPNMTSVNTQLSLNGLAKGIYMIRMISNGREIQGKVVVK